jgi:hypothetical protein
MTLSYFILQEIRDYNDRDAHKLGMFVDLQCTLTGTILTALALCNYIALEGNDKRYRWAQITTRGRSAVERFDRLAAALDSGELQ